jgi:hypothetical protein
MAVREEESERKKSATIVEGWKIVRQDCPKCLYPASF